MHGSEAKSLRAEAQAFLSAQSWDGNVRELRNAMEKLVILASEPNISARLIQNILHYHQTQESTPPRETLRQAREAFERSYIQATLHEFIGNMSEAAAALDIDRSHLYRKMEQLGIKGQVL